MQKKLLGSVVYISIYAYLILNCFYFLKTKVQLNILWLQFPEEFLPCLFPCLARWLVTRSLCVQALCLLWVQGVTDCYSLCGGFCFQCAFWYVHWTIGWSLGKKVKRSIFNHNLQIFHRKMALAFSVIYTFCCLTKLSPNFWWLFVGRLFGGIATSMLFSTFESWYVYEHSERHGFPSEWIGMTFSITTFWNGMIAILAGNTDNVLSLLSSIVFSRNNL